MIIDDKKIKQYKRHDYLSIDTDIRYHKGLLYTLKSRVGYENSNISKEHKALYHHEIISGIYHLYIRIEEHYDMFPEKIQHHYSYKAHNITVL